MCKRLYKEYAVIITKDKNRNRILVDETVDTSNYKLMLSLYQEAKEEFKDEECTIELVGVNEDDTEGSAIYIKEIKKEIENQDLDLLIGTDEIITDIKRLFSILQRKREYHDLMVSAKNKEQDLLLHRIESFNDFSGSKEEILEEKIDIFDKLEEIRHSRRFHKSEQGKVNSVNKILAINNIVGRLEQIKIPIEENHDYLNEGKAEELNIMKKLEYRTEKEKQHHINQHKGKYAKIVDDKPNSTLILYNYAYYSNANK